MRTFTPQTLIAEDITKILNNSARTPNDNCLTLILVKVISEKSVKLSHFQSNIYTPAYWTMAFKFTYGSIKSWNCKLRRKSKSRRKIRLLLVLSQLRAQIMLYSVSHPNNSDRLYLRIQLGHEYMILKHANFVS